MVAAGIVLKTIVNTSEALCKKHGRKFRVARSAKKIGVKASAQERMAMSFNKTREMTDELYAQYHHFQTEPSIEMVQKLANKHHPGINIRVAPLSKTAKINGSLGMRKSAANGAIDAYELILPTEKNISGQIIIPKKKLGTVAHELTHLNDYIYNPIMIARKYFEHKLNPNLHPGQRILIGNELEGFYKQNLYRDETAGTLNSIDDEAINWKRKQKLTTKIVKFLRPNTNEENIAIMQSWRTRLKTELNAYTEGEKVKTSIIANAMKENKVKIPKNSDISKEDFLANLNLKYLDNYSATMKHNVQNTVKAKRFYEDKIALLENLIKAQIRGVRKQHAKMFPQAKMPADLA